MPGNDNFANAVALGATGGNTPGSNVGAGVEAGEPGKLMVDPTSSGNLNPVFTAAAQNTVWWAWTCPATGSYYFSTAGQTGGSNQSTNFQSVLQAFTANNPSSPAVNALTETPYLMNQSCGIGNGFQYGALVAFNATAGTIYYLRVDGRAGATGNINLEWAVYNFTTLGSCGECSTSFDSAECLGYITIPDVTTDSILSFGEFPAMPGLFQVAYCKGSFLVGNEYSNFCGFVFQNGTCEIWDKEADYNVGQQVLSTNPWWNTQATHNGLYLSGGSNPSYWPSGDGSDWNFYIEDLSPAPTPAYPAGTIFCLALNAVTGGANVGQPNWTIGYSDGYIYSPSNTIPGGVLLDIPNGLTILPPGNYVSDSSGLTIGTPPANPQWFEPLVGNVYESLDAVPAYQPGFGGNWNFLNQIVTSKTLYQSLGALEQNSFCGATSPFFHTAGEIGIAFPTSWETVVGSLLPGHLSLSRQSQWKNTASNPTVQLLYSPLLISMLFPVSCGISNQGSNSWGCGIIVNNSSATAWPSVQFQLLNTGGVSNASGPLSANFPANGNSPEIESFFFNADFTAGLVTLTFQVSINGIVVGNLVFPAYPSYTALANSFVAETACGAVKLRNYTLNFSSTGVGCVPAFSSERMIITAIDSNTNQQLQLISGENCSTLSTSITTIGNFLILGIQAASAPRNVLLTIQPQWSQNSSPGTYVNLPAIQIPLTIPAA